MNSYSKRNREAGVATLITAVILMLAVFGVSYLISETVINEKQIAANDVRAKQAFMAAQSGIEYGKAVVNEGLCATGTPCSPIVGQGSVTVEVVSGSTSSIYHIQAVGLSDDGSVQRTMTVSIGRLPAESYPPNVPIVARGGLGLTGNVKAVNNESALTVWSGNDFGLNGSANTYISIDGNANQLSSIKTPGGNNVYGPDVLTNDPNLKNATEEEILNAFFGKQSLYEFAPGYPSSDPTQAADLVNTCENTASCSLDNISEMSNYNIANYENEETDFFSYGDFTLGNSDVPSGVMPTESLTEWEASTGGSPDRNDLIESGSVAGSNLTFGNTAVLGTPSNPVRIVVNGKLTINSSPQIFGIIIAKEIEFKGSPIVVGGIVALSSDPDAVTGNGTPTVIMDKTVINNTQSNPGFGPIKNSWKDW